MAHYPAGSSLLPASERELLRATTPDLAETYAPHHPAGRGWTEEPAPLPNAPDFLWGGGQADAGTHTEQGADDDWRADIPLPPAGWREGHDPHRSESEWTYGHWRQAEQRMQHIFAALPPASAPTPLPGDDPELVHWFAIREQPQEAWISRPMPHQFTPERRVRFLDQLATCGNVRAACIAAGISAPTAYKLRRRMPLFARAWDAALAIAAPHVDAVIHDRAINGVEEPVLYKGEVVATRRRYDNRLLLALAGRLDAKLADPRVAADAGRFDALVAMVAGEEPGSAAVTREAHCRAAEAAAEYSTGCAHEMWEEEEVDPAQEAWAAARADATVAARTHAAAEWDAAEARVHAQVDALAGTLAPQSKGAPQSKSEPEVEFEPFERPDPAARSFAAAGRVKSALLNSVNGVNPLGAKLPEAAFLPPLHGRPEPRITRM